MKPEDANELLEELRLTRVWLSNEEQTVRNLRALNAELVEALGTLHEITGYALPYVMGEWLTKGTAPYDNRYEIETAMEAARAVLEKAKGQ